MDKFYIKGGLKLDGEAEVYSAKNAVLALLAASILTEEQIYEYFSCIDYIILDEKKSIV